MRVLSGIQPTGQLHLGNYAGAVRQFLDLQAEGHDLFVFVASYHALTTVRDPAQLAANVRQAATDFLAFGLDPARCAIYRQQDVPEVTELCWLLSCVCPMGWMEKMVSYKDKLAKGLPAGVGLFNYPLLQAADILAPQGELVPVGKDQVQHIEITRDLAERFHQEFGAAVFTLPGFRLAKEAEVLPGIDGEKMSKSYGNTIDPFAEEKALKKRIMAIKTDTAGMHDSRDPEACHIWRIARGLCGTADARVADMARKLREPPAEGYGYGHAKLELLGIILDHFAAARQRRAALMADPGAVDAVLRQGAERARAAAAKTVAAARAACGL
jgi:tryptophanyl-tRNA synthetase